MQIQPAGKGVPSVPVAQASPLLQAGKINIDDASTLNQGDYKNAKIGQQKPGRMMVKKMMTKTMPKTMAGRMNHLIGGGK